MDEETALILIDTLDENTNYLKSLNNCISNLRAEWIDVNDKDNPPPFDQSAILVCTSEETFTSKCYGLNCDGEPYFDCTGTVTGWMLLPEPMK